MEEVFHLQIKKVSVDQRIICTSKCYLQIEELPADRKIICRAKNYLQTEKVFDL